MRVRVRMTGIHRKHVEEAIGTSVFENINSDSDGMIEGHEIEKVWCLQLAWAAHRYVCVCVYGIIRAQGHTGIGARVYIYTICWYVLRRRPGLYIRRPPMYHAWRATRRANSFCVSCGC